MERVYEMIEIIKKAFPQGIEGVYYDLIGCLKEDFTQQNLAALLSYISGTNIDIIKRDILSFESSEKNEEVYNSLIQAGYQRA